MYHYACYGFLSWFYRQSAYFYILKSMVYKRRMPYLDPFSFADVFIGLNKIIFNMLPNVALIYPAIC